MLLLGDEVLRQLDLCRLEYIRWMGVDYALPISIAREAGLQSLANLLVRHLWAIPGSHLWGSGSRGCDVGVRSVCKRRIAAPAAKESLS